MRAIDLVMKLLSENKIEDAEKLLVDIGHIHIKYGAKTEHIPVKLHSISIFLNLKFNFY